MEKAIKISNIYYNNAIKMAQKKELSVAIEYLRICLLMNKENIQARNLLGLCYFACGYSGEALREWIISMNYQNTDNLAFDYLDRFKNSVRFFDAQSSAVKMYNEALLYASQNSEDLAIIRLKRALEINSKFVIAMNLLTFLYIKNENISEANKLINKVLNIDKTNPKALYYRSLLTNKTYFKKWDQSQKSIKPDEKQEIKPQFLKVSSNTSGSSKFTIPLLTLIVGGAIMFAFMHFLIIPTLRDDLNSEITTLEQRIEQQQSEHIVEISARNEEISSLEQNNASLVSDLNRTQAELNILNNEQRVTSAAAMMGQGLYIEALRLLDEVNISPLSSEMATVFDGLMAELSPTVEVLLLQEGLELFELENYTQARLILERASELDTPISATRGNIFHILGQIAEIYEDFSLARYYYEYILANFPANSAIANQVRARLNELDELD